eukprot:3124351-Prymnesium_polylepis.1
MSLSQRHAIYPTDSTVSVGLYKTGIKPRPQTRWTWPALLAGSTTPSRGRSTRGRWTATAPLRTPS